MANPTPQDVAHGTTVHDMAFGETGSGAPSRDMVCDLHFAASSDLTNCAVDVLKSGLVSGRGPE